MSHRALIIGLGSMGKRRIRCLRALGVSHICGVDTRADRSSAARSEIGIDTFPSIELALEKFSPTVVFISVDPDRHLECLTALEFAEVDVFIEASVVDGDQVLANATRMIERGRIVVPSSTMRYFPGPRLLREKVSAGLIGHPILFTYHVGQYLPDWHPWEEIGDYYVSQHATGGCREIVPFELVWLDSLFGDVAPLVGVKCRTGLIPADIDDQYAFVAKFGSSLIGSVVVEVLSRPRTSRALRLIGSDGILVIDGDRDEFRFISSGDDVWTIVDLKTSCGAEPGYIYSEEPYHDEVRDFLLAVSERKAELFPHSMVADARVLRALEAIESGNGDV